MTVENEIHEAENYVSDLKIRDRLAYRRLQ